TDQLTTYFYDGLGRLRTTKSRTADDAAWDFIADRPPAGFKTTANFTSYGPMSRKWRESINQAVASDAPTDEPQETPVWRTEYLDYDALGRARKIVQWQGGAPTNKEIQYQYVGDRYVKETVRPVSAPGDAGFGGANGGSTTKQTQRDIWGRIVRVDDQSAPGAQSTFYDYDVFGNLSRVRQATPSTSQVRTFLHDNRGFLASMTLPELGSAGRGTVSFSGIDAMGHATHKQYGNGSAQDLFFEFDAAERPVYLMGANSHYALGGALKHFTYFPGNTAACDGSDCGFSGGKLEFAERHNYLPKADGTGNSSDVEVQEHFRYQQAGGKVSEIETKIIRQGQTLPENTLKTTFSYDGLGNVADVGYPNCSACAGGVGALQTRSRYQYGQLKGVGDNGGAVYAPNLTYWPSGLLASVLHGNNTTDVWEDEDGLGRPNRISLKKGGAQLWSTGDYNYDAAGNILKIGDDQYAYDNVNRLVFGRVSGVTRRYEFDRYGNITHFNSGAGLNGYDQLIPVDAGSNHIAAANGNRAQYDAAGNMTVWKDLREPSPSLQWATLYAYDGLGQMTHIEGPGLWKNFVYNASDERLAVIDFRSPAGGPSGTPPTTLERWSLRGAHNEVLRDFTVALNPAAGGGRIWNQEKDYIYRGGSLLNARPSNSGIQGNHYHLDHLGSPRIITNPSGTIVARRTFLPF
ncbi:MAG TPA: hypothetical protein VN605_01535, partial [Thermoanaerobaculia bacterium]|nr:hypothetical protein [Thermoanaerobaculia bacterium]